MTRLLPVLGLTSLVAAVVAATSMSGSGDTGGPPSGARGAQIQQEWRRLPPLPLRATIDLDGAALVAIGGRVHAAVVDRARRRTAASRLRVHSWDGKRWSEPIGGRSLPINRGEPFSVVGNGRPCLAAPYRRAVRMWCASPGRPWQRIGGVIFSTSFPEPRTTFAGAFTSQGRLYVLQANLQDARIEGAALAGRTEHRVFTLKDGRWMEPAPGDIDPTAPLGTQRPFGVTLGGRPCLAYDWLSNDASRGPEVRVRCLRGSHWEEAGLPALTLTMVAPRVEAPGREAINADGATVASGRLYVGVDHFRPRSVRWPVYVGDRAGWTDAGFSRREPPGWNAQGSLHSIDGEPWGVRFDQRSAGNGLRTQVVVLRGVDGQVVRQVGQPLLRDTPFYGPVYWGLAQARDGVFAAATVPVPRRRRNEFRVFMLDQRVRR